jgi:O-antigen ligase
LPTNALHLLDNQYFMSAVNMGIPGLVATLAYFLVPGVFVLLAASCATDPKLRMLGGGIAAGCFVAAFASATFDSLSFPVFALLYPFFIGLSGSIWLIVRREAKLRPDTLPAVQAAQNPGGNRGSRFSL